MLGYGQSLIVKFIEVVRISAVLRQISFETLLTRRHDVGVVNGTKKLVQLLDNALSASSVFPERKSP